MAALSWSLFGLVATMCGGLLAALYALIGRMDALGTDLRADMRGLRGEFHGEFQGLRGEFQGLRGEFQGLRGEFQGLRAEVRTDIAELRVAVDDIDRRLRGSGL